MSYSKMNLKFNKPMGKLKKEFQKIRELPPEEKKIFNKALLFILKGFLIIILICSSFAFIIYELTREQTPEEIANRSNNLTIIKNDLGKERILVYSNNKYFTEKRIEEYGVDYIKGTDNFKEFNDLKRAKIYLDSLIKNEIEQIRYQRKSKFKVQ